jgi:uncharacterized protein YjbI with pentapeptide repeats
MTQTDRPSVHPFFRNRRRRDPAREKLLLEVRELRRSPWTRPVVLVPLFVTVVTVGLSQYLGVFDVERKRIELIGASAELRNREAQLQYREIQMARAQSQREVEDLEARRAALRGEGQQLTKDRDQLVRQIAMLEAETRNLAAERKRMEESRRVAKEKLNNDLKLSELAAQDRLDRVVSRLAERDATKRQAAVMTLRSYLGQDQRAHHLEVLLALAGALALEDTVGVRHSLVRAIADVDPAVIDAAGLSATLQTLLEVNRGLVKEIALHDGWLARDPVQKDRQADANLQATADAIAALLRKGVKVRNLKAIYLGRVDLSHLDLSSVVFDGSVLTDADFSDAKLMKASFDTADLLSVDFKRADLRGARFTLPLFYRAGAIRQNYIEPWMDYEPGKRYWLTPPNFQCADLRDADFYGHPLLPVFVDGSGLSQFISWPGSFAFANLQGANLREIQIFGIWRLQDVATKEGLGIPFDTGGGMSRPVGKGLVSAMFFIDPDAPLTTHLSKFSGSLQKVTWAFRGTNWDQAQLPRAVRQWLELHPPAQRPEKLGQGECG